MLYLRIECPNNISNQRPNQQLPVTNDTVTHYHTMQHNNKVNLHNRGYHHTSLKAGTTLLRYPTGWAGQLSTLRATTRLRLEYPTPILNLN